MDQLNNLKMLVLGDFHLNKTKHIIEKVEKGTIIPIAKWKCSNWALIKDAKKEYFKYKKDSGCPDIVVLSVGNNDLLKVSSEHLIMTSLLRLANLLHKDGVKIVVLFSLVERNIPVGPYNQQVEKINKVLERKAKKLDWLFFFKLWETTKFLGTVCLLKGFHLPNTEHKRLASLLQNLYFKPDIKKILKDNRDVSEAQSSQGESMPRGKATANQKQALFLPEVERLKGRLVLMTQEKSKTTEYLNKLADNISSLNEYIARLEKIRL